MTKHLKDTNISTKDTKYNIAIVGATGLVGTTLLQILKERALPLKDVYLIASHNSLGKSIEFNGHTHTIHDLEEFDFKKTQIAFFCVSNQLAAEYIPKATRAGNIVIDKSNRYRRDANVPLIVPEVNLKALAQYQHKNIIASPNCNTIPIAVALKPIYDAVGIERLNVATYQSVSGTGKDAIFELEKQSKQLLESDPRTRENIQPKIYSQQIAFNVLPHCDDFDENGYTLEEMKIVWEMQKIFDDHTIAINPTAVRVPVFCGHAASVHLETKEKISVKETERLLASAPGIKLMTGKYPYATPAHDAAGKDFVYIGRLREDISHQKGLNLWIVADNLRKGAALNAVQIFECLIQQYL